MKPSPHAYRREEHNGAAPDCRSGVEYGFALHVHVHDGASIVTVEGSIPAFAVNVPQSLRQLVSFVIDEVQAGKGLIGHVKAFATDNGAICWVSGTGADLCSKRVEQADAPSSEPSFSFVAIVFRMSPAVLERIVRQGLQLWGNKGRAMEKGSMSV